MRLASIALAVTALALPSARTAQSRPDGQHDFDFEFGRWHVQLKNGFFAR